MYIHAEKYKNFKAPRKASEAAKKYIKGEIGLDELFTAKHAAYAANAAYAAYAADAYAADADDAADDAAAYAADDAAAYAANAADDADDYKTKLLNILRNKIKTPILE